MELKKYDNAGQFAAQGSVCDVAPKRVVEPPLHQCTSP